MLLGSVLCVIGIIETHVTRAGMEHIKIIFETNVWVRYMWAPAILSSSSASPAIVDGTFKLILPHGYQA